MTMTGEGLRAFGTSIHQRELIIPSSIQHEVISLIMIILSFFSFNNGIHSLTHSYSYIQFYITDEILLLSLIELATTPLGRRRCKQ